MLKSWIKPVIEVRTKREAGHPASRDRERSGAVALVWSRSQTMTRDINATRRLLDNTARDVSALTCGGTADDNNVWGERSGAVGAVAEALLPEDRDAYERNEASWHRPRRPIQGAGLQRWRQWVRYSGMRLGTRSVRKTLPYLAPAVLAAVALVQIYHAFSSGLSPWKGGGFGMFSTIRSPASRMTRAYLVTKERRIPIPIPEPIKELEREARTFPTASRLGQAAEKLGAGRWTTLRFVSAEQRYRELKRLRVQTPAAEATALIDQAFDKLDFLRMLDDGEEAASTVDFTSVEVEVWQLRMSGRKRQLSAELITRVASTPRGR